MQFTKLKRLRITDVVKLTCTQEMLCPSIEHIEFRGCDLLDKDVFPLISKICPNLKAFSINFCKYDDRIVVNQDLQIKCHLVSIDIPTTRLINLRILLEKSVVFNHNSYDLVFIRLKTNNKKTRYSKVVFNPFPTKIDFVEEGCMESDYELWLKDERDQSIVYDLHFDSVINPIVAAKTDDDDDYDEDEDETYKERFYLEEDL